MKIGTPKEFCVKRLTTKAVGKRGNGAPHLRHPRSSLVSATPASSPSPLKKTTALGLTAALLGLLFPSVASADYTHPKNNWEYVPNTVHEREGVLYNAFFDTEHLEIEFPEAYMNGNLYLDSNNDNLPNELNVLAETMERAWTEFIEMGYESPRNVFNITQLYVLVDVDEDLIDRNLLGYATVSENSKGEPTFPYIVLNGKDLLLGKNRSRTEAEEARLQEFYATAVHELFHIFQFGYNPEFVYAYDNVNFAEGSAEWVTDVILPTHQGYERDLADYLGYPEYSLFGVNRPNEYFKYGTALWPKFLSEKYDNILIRRIFEAYFKQAIEAGEWYNSVITATEGTLQQIAKTDLAKAYQEFMIWNYDQTRYKEGWNYPDVKIQETVNKFPYNRETSTVGEYYARPRLYGSNYIVLETKDKGQDLTVRFEGHEDAKWGLVFLADSGGKVEELKRTVIFPKEKTATVQLAGAGDYEKVVMIVSVIGSADAYDFATESGYKYNYTAEFADQSSTLVQPGVSFESNALNQPKPFDGKGFADVASNHKNSRAIRYLKENNVISGYPDGTFQPGKTINRAELMKILVTNQGLNPDPAFYKSCFPDVTEEWFAPYVCYAEAQGWVDGYPDGTFKPANTVNKVEALKMLLNSRGIVVTNQVSALPFSDTKSSDWYAPYLDSAYRFGLLEEAEGGKMNPSSGMDRGAASENIYRLLQILRTGTPGPDRGVELPAMADYLNFKEGVWWTMRDEATDTAETLTMTRNCTEYPNCLVMESPSGKTYVVMKGNRVNTYKGVSEWGTILFHPFQTLVSDRDFVQYVKLEGTISLESLGVPLKYNLIDSIVKFEVMDGEEQITTEAGTFTARKVKSTILVNAEGTLTIDEEGTKIPVELEMIVEEMDYLVTGVGTVRNESITTVRLFGEAVEERMGEIPEPEVTEETSVLVEWGE